MTALQSAIVELSPADVRLFEERLENENLLLDLAHRLSTRPLVNQNASPNVEKSQKLIPSYKTYYLGSVNDGASTSSSIVDAVSPLNKHPKSSQLENFLLYSVPEKLNKRPLRSQNVSLNVEKPQKLISSYKTLYLGSVNEGASTSGGIVHAVSSSHTPPESLQLESSVKESRPTTTTTTIVPTEHNQQFISSNAAFKRYTFQKFIYAILQSEKDHFQAVQVAFNYFDRHFPQLKEKFTPKVTSHRDDIVSIINSFNDDEVEEDIVVGYKPYHLFDYIEKSKSFSQNMEERFLYYQYYETSNFNRRARVIDCFLKSNKEITPLAICKEKSTNNDDEINFSQNLQREPSRMPNFKEFKEPSESVMLVSESTGTPAISLPWYLEVNTYKQEQSKNEKTLAGFDYYMTPLQILASKYRGPPTRSAMQFLSRLSDADISEAMKNLLSLPEILNDPKKANGKGDVAITTTSNAKSSPSAAVAASLPTTAAQPEENRTPTLQQSQPTPVNPTPLTTTIERVIENGSQKSCETVQVMPKGKNQIEVIDLVSDDDYDSGDSDSDDSDYSDSDSDSDDIIFVKEVINNPQKEVEKSGPAVAVAAAVAAASVAAASVAAATAAEVAATGAEVPASDHSEVTGGGGHEVAKEKGEEEEEDAEKAQDVEKTDLSEPSPSPSPLPLPLPPPIHRVPVPTAVIPPDLMAIHTIATTEFFCRRGGCRPFRSVARQRQMIKIERLPANFHFISRLHDLVPSKKHERFINQFTPQLSRLAPLVPTKQEMRKSRELKAKMKRSLAASAAARAKKGGASAGQSTSSNKRPYLIGTRCSSRISAQQAVAAAAAFFDSISNENFEQQTIQPINGRQQRAAKRRLQPDCPSNSTDTPANSFSSNNGNVHEESGPSRNKKRVRFAEDLIQPAAAATPTAAKPTTAKSKRPAAPPAATKSTAGKGKRPASKDSSTATKSKRPAASPAPTAATTSSSSSGVKPEAPETEAPVVAHNNNNNNNNIQKQKPKPKHQSLRPPPRTFDPAEAANVAVDRRNYSFHCLYPGCSHKFSSTLYFEATEHVRMQHFYASTKTVKASELLSDTWEHPAKWVHTEKRTLANG